MAAMTWGWPTVAPLLAMLLAGLGVAARRLGIPSSILMLVAGVLLSLVEPLRSLRLDPEVVLTWLLPPLLYSSGVGMSWRGFRSNLRPILLLAVGCVLFTAAAVAAVAHWLTGLPWAVAFILGAVVAPPDAVAPMAILRRHVLPRRLITVLEGESLVNDATALVIFGFAVQAVGSGDIQPLAAVARFLLVVGGELGWGIAIGWALLRLRHLANEPRAEVLLALATPFVAFWPPHALGASGVVACVAAGLWVSWNGPGLIRPATRLQGFFIWNLVTWSVEALVFLLTGLQAFAVVNGLGVGEPGGGGWGRALALGGLTAAAVIVVRFVWVYPATYLPRLIPAVRARDPFPDWRQPFLIGFTGLRGVVSLAAALSVPYAVPGRELVLFATFAVIIATLVGEGALLPVVVRRLALERLGREEAAANRHDERTVRIEAVDAVLRAIDGADLPAGETGAAEALRRHHRGRRDALARSADRSDDADPVADYGRLQGRLLDVERHAIARAYAENRMTDEARRRAERELDLEEARLEGQVSSGGATDDLPT